MSNSEAKNSIAKERFTSSAQQGSQISLELQQQISILNARINNANFAFGDLLRQMNDTFNTLLSTIIALQKENTELKAKPLETSKT